MCWQHGVTEIGLRVKPSTIAGAGFGLFAARDFPKHTIVCEYEGDVIDGKELDKRYGSDERAEYAISIPGTTKFIDAIHSNDGFARFANHVPKQESNIEFVGKLVPVEVKSTKVKNKERQRNTVVATVYKIGLQTRRAIKAGEELFVDYGKDYWSKPSSSKEVASTKAVAVTKTKTKTTTKTKTKAMTKTKTKKTVASKTTAVAEAAAADNRPKPIRKSEMEEYVKRKGRRLIV
jgi:SET domain-containing protein